MVFENVFANLINTYLSNFVDDVSSNQLKLGAWKGNLQLTNLSVKENALDALHLPFQIKHGRIGVLSASIPWSSLYTSPVVFKLSNILVVAVPNVNVSAYDEERAAKTADIAKQQLLASIEEAFQKAKEKEAKKKRGEQDNDDDKLKNKDDFVTKLTAQIIKNVQIRIDKVHLRFEDNFTDSLTPYVAGLTLDQLIFETQSRTEMSDRYQDAASDDIIYKLVSLANLSLYWNVIEVREEKKFFISYVNQVEEREDRLLKSIANNNFIPQDLKYVLKPITFTADAMINRKPQLDYFGVPVLDIDVSLNDFRFGMHRKQFESLLALLDSLGRMKLALPHAKWRPNVPVYGSGRLWWEFAIIAILENDVRRKRRVWSWGHMWSHRMKMKEYLEAYKEKLLKPKNLIVVERVELLEKELDVFNIILVRRQAETAVAPQLKKMEAEKKEKEKKGSGGGWFGGWWGSGKKSDDSEDSSSVNVIEDFKKEMTQEEKDKLYSAIGYGEAGDTEYPSEYAAHLLSLEVKSITFVLVDDGARGHHEKQQKERQILHVSLLDVETKLRHRPASKGVEIISSVYDLTIFGMNSRPLIREETPEKAFIVEFQSNPVHKQFDFGVVVKTNPLHFVYDAFTVNALVGMFSKPSDLTMRQIQAMTEDRLARLKKMSATGLEHAISQHPDVSINIDLAPFFLIIPHDDKVWEDDVVEEAEEFLDARERVGAPSDCLIACLGRVRIESIHMGDKKRAFEVRSLSKRETPESIIAIVRERAYESYRLSLTEVQVMLSSSASWKHDIGFSRGNEYSIHPESQALLKPVSLEVLFQRCIITDDPDLPKCKVKAVVPSVSIVASDLQLVKSLKILMEITTPQSDSPKDVLNSDKISIGPTLDQPDAITHETLMKSIAISDRAPSIASGNEDPDLIEVEGEQVDASPKQDMAEFAAEFEITEISCDLRQDQGDESVMTMVVQELVGKLDAETSRRKLVFGTGEVCLNISPNTVQFLMSVINQIGSETTDSSGQDSSLTTIRSSDLLTPAPIDANNPDQSFLKRTISKAVEVMEDTELGIVDLSPASPTSTTTPEHVNANMNRDQVMMNISSIKIILETGGASSRPILNFQTSLSGKLDGWTRLSSNVTLVMTYYNERVMSWEPVIEPIDTSGKVWCAELKAKISDSEESAIGPKISASLESVDRLEVTISKTFVSVVSRLGVAFDKAVKKSDKAIKSTDITHVVNSLGMDLMIVVDNSKYSYDWNKVVAEVGRGHSILLLHPSDEIELTQTRHLRGHHESSGEFIARLILDNKEINRNIVIKSKCRKVFDLPVLRYPVSRLRWVLNVDILDFGNRKVTFGTPIELVNNMQKSIDVYIIQNNLVAMELTERNESNAVHSPLTRQEVTAVKIGSVDPASSWFLPLSLVYSDTDLIFVAASNQDYCIPNQGIPFKELSTREGKSLYVRCEPKIPNKPCINMQVVSTTNDELFEDTNVRSAKYITIEVNPTLVLQNLLPVPITYILPLCEEGNLAPGERHQLGMFDPSSPVVEISIPDYLGTKWTCVKKVEVKNIDEDDVSVWTFSPAESGVGSRAMMSPTNSPSKRSKEVRGPQLLIAISLSKPYSSKPVLAQVFAPFWLVNRTGMKLVLKSGDMIWHHPPESSLPLLFSFKPGKLFKQKMQMQIEDSNLSNSFSIDAVGNQGNVLCHGKDSKTTFCVSIDIALSSFSLTKIVTFSPFYSVINRTGIFVEVSDDGHCWVPMNATSKIAFWPKDVAIGNFFIKCNDSVSSAVTFKESNSTLITVGSDLFNVLVDVTDSGIKIQLSDYDEGSCPVRIFNSTPIPVLYWQRELNHAAKTLNPNNSVYFLWQQPCGVRELVCKMIGESCDTTSGETVMGLDQDTFGQMNEIDEVFWVSFLDGRQRTLLITQDSDVATSALQATEFTKPNINMDVSMKGLGVSIVNDELQTDLVYMGVYGSETIWEVKKLKSKRFKSLQVKQIEALEAAYQREMGQRKVEHGQFIPSGPRILALAFKIKVDMTDLNNMIMLEPVRGILRRYASPGFYANITLSDHVVQMHAKIARVQIDNQQGNCLFNIIMCPVTPPKSLSLDRAPKPFIEFSVVLQKSANLHRYKYLSVLVQEFLVQIDGAFLLSMGDFFGQSSESVNVNYETLMANDMKQLTESEEINDDTEVILSKAYYDVIHFSPLKVHVSFSLGGISSFQVFGVLDLLMRSAGVTLTEFKDVTFRIDFFERKNLLLDNQQLVSQATTHYMRQVLKQFYVIVLGLDVIGNPVGLVLGLKTGIGDFFYEPLMGIIEGPEEFAEGLALGVKSLLSHTFGGAAGALSKITGTLGEGVSALTMDDEFIRRRRMRMQRKQNVADSGKELAQGFWRGLTGIIRKPIEGARDDGLEGLMKGIGKGAVGVIVQPATGVIDFASGSLGALRRAVDINAEAKKQRPPRFFQPDTILRPYNLHEATGNQILQMMDKGSFSQSDKYRSHCVLRHPANASREIIVLVSNHRVFILKDSCLFGTQDIEWKADLSHIDSIAVHNQSVIKLTLRQQRTKLCVINEGNEKLVYCHSPESAKWLHEKLTTSKALPPDA